MAETIDVELKFDSVTGELKDVKPKTPGAERQKLGEMLSLKKDFVYKGDPLSKIKSHSYLYGTGSPGCVYFKTSAGYIRICW